MKEKISTRWFHSGILTIAFIVVVVSVCVAFVSRNYYYSSIEQTINGHIINFMNYLDSTTYTENSFDEIARDYVENFQYKEQIGLVAYDCDDEIITSTTGMNTGYDTIPHGYEDAKNSPQNSSLWVGRQSTGEKVIAVTNIIYSTNETQLGAIYATVSLEKSDFQIMILILASILLSIVVAIPSVLSSSRFLKSVIYAIDRISASTKQIALGKFEVRVEKKRNDEIGDLCDAINSMATELGKNEQLKNDFISSVSHELRTPLTAIKGWAETMQFIDASEIKTMNKGLSIIAKETERLSDIVEELLDFSRIQSKRMTLILEKVDISAELDEAVYMYKERALSENKHLVFETDGDIYPVLGDKNRLKQVFVNLIDNALKYTDDDALIAVSLKRDDDNVYITVSDTGCGIPKDALPKVTEKFFKVNNTRRGSGIGLAIVKEIINLHSGTFRIESEEGIGTTVVVSVPLLKEQI